MFLYRCLISLAAPFVLIRLLWRLARGRETLRGVGDRLGGGVSLRGHPVLWLHGASNGELASARGVVDTLLARDPDLHVLITTNTETGRALALGWGLGRTHVQIAPLDHRLVLARFLARTRPRAALVLENELWPNRFAALARRVVPVLIVGGRLSDRTARGWDRLGVFTRGVMDVVRWVSAQDEAMEAKFRALGVSPDRIGPVINLKAAAALRDAGAIDTSGFHAFTDRASTLLAASTHEGEDEAIVTGFAAARATRPDLRLILAPRHPRRGPRIAALLTQAGLTHATRSAGEVPGPDQAVYLADTMGEMALWYRLAGITFVGGSLVDAGGHTPFEPAGAGSAILHGPHVGNFCTAYAALAAAGGARLVGGAGDLTTALLDLSAPGAQAAMARAATLALRDVAGSAGQEPLFSALAKLAGISVAKP